MRKTNKIVSLETISKKVGDKIGFIKRTSVCDNFVSNKRKSLKGKPINVHSQFSNKE